MCCVKLDSVMAEWHADRHAPNFIEPKEFVVDCPDFGQDSTGTDCLCDIDFCIRAFADF
jgi:hypothetical protein